MDKLLRQNIQQPRHLHYRNHYKSYFVFFAVTSVIVLAYWALQFIQGPIKQVYLDQTYELMVSGCYFFVFASFYFLWLRPRLKRSVQVFETHILVHNNKEKIEVNFNEIESISIICWSLFYFKMKNGVKHYFNSSLERVDYIWEMVKEKRPDLMDATDYEVFRLKLVQYDHYQKRKEWFFRHKFADVVNWVVLPFTFLSAAFVIQSQNVIIYHQGLYFFRLLMYSILVMLITTFLFSIALKKFVFDERIQKQLGDNPGDKLRDLEFEGVILHRSKIFQFMTACFVFSLIIKADVNLYSVTKVKESIEEFGLKAGKTVFIDNRYNCVGCKYELTDGDLVMFGRGYVGEIMAKQGDYVGQFYENKNGRKIASENIQEVPVGHVAVRSKNGQELIYIKMSELIGKIKK